jgi:hypothetical protein
VFDIKNFWFDANIQSKFPLLSRVVIGSKKIIDVSGYIGQKVTVGRKKNFFQIFFTAQIDTGQILNTFAAVIFSF